MTFPTRHQVTHVVLTEKQLKSHAVHLTTWLWPGIEPEFWQLRLACAKTLADLTLRFHPLTNPDTRVLNWAKHVAAMLNGAEHVYGDPVPFTAEPGKLPGVLPWRYLVIYSLAMLPGDRYLMCNTARIALNTIDAKSLTKAELARRAKSFGADVVHYLNAQGHGNSIAWFRHLDVTKHQAALTERVHSTLHAWVQSFDYFATQFPQAHPQVRRLDGQARQMESWIADATRMIPLALQDIASFIAPLQESIPANADEELEALASIPFRLRNMNPNPYHIARIDLDVIEPLFAYYVHSNTAGKGVVL